MRWTVGLILIAACAREGLPPGGPEDRTPPQIIEAFPQQNATHVPLSTRLQFVFSEKVDRASFEQAFFISPTPRGKPLRFRWHGRRVEVVFPDSLRRRTYVATIGTDVRDLRGNRMERAFSLAFSTGDRIDTGEIRGRIFHERPAGILMLAYLLETERAPDPAQDEADYLTQVGKEGDFVLPYLSEGRYRVFALEDRNGNRLYNPGEEAIGVPTRDVVVDSSRLQHTELNFRLAIADTLRPGLAAITAFDQI
ncbi:MAG: Ig-like domain-containing protein, partial [candidate division KSB1 bacterium]|nr:Ig-like domain-containing protein [candidate division KSB1 bacterium]